MDNSPIVVLRNVLASRKKEYIPEREEIILTHLSGDEAERRLAASRVIDALWNYDNSMTRPRAYPTHQPMPYSSVILRVTRNDDTHLEYYMRLAEHLAEICVRANVKYIPSLSAPHGRV